MDDFSSSELAVVERFMNKHYPYLKEIVALGNKVAYGQSNVTIRWHDGKGTDVVHVTNFVRKKIKDGEYAKEVDSFIEEIGSGQLNVTLQVKDNVVTDIVAAVAYERKQFV